jgi:hypothetical protein
MSIRFCLDMIPPYPPSINESYGPFGFYKFGVGCWQYDLGFPGSKLYDGAVEYINTEHFCTEPKYINPYAFRYVLFDGVSATKSMAPVLDSNIPDSVVQGEAVNAVVGKGLPLLLKMFP